MDQSSKKLKLHEIAFEEHIKYTPTPDFRWDQA